MQMNVHALRCPLPEGAVTILRHRADTALGRFASRISSLDVRISDVNGPRGGMGFSCLARVRLRQPSIEILANAQSDDPLHGAAEALERARASVAAAVQRFLTLRRRP